MKKGICWAFAALQVTPENISTKDGLEDAESFDLPLDSSNLKNNNNNNNNNNYYHHNKNTSSNEKHHHHPQPLGQKNASADPTNPSAVSLLKTTVHSVVDALLGSHEDQENVQPRFTRQEVADHSSPDSCWIVVNNRVYDVTLFLRMHPGGDDIILEYGGYDATTAFIEKGHSPDAFDMLSEYCIGEVAEEDRFPEINHT
ncbi:cytochrome b5 [Plakobranchus ocellatus]|uniref:Cytochrome b5 n=1 Tax=Plakobranchus ocellatus TaxID=259542 RepID=A0AAV4CSB6_9GAST|nr:cytochrome b5 [Plakobranchus ocellatus]